MVCMLTGFFGPDRRFGDGLEVWPFALFAAFAMTIPYVIVAAVLGPEFPALLGGLIGLVIVVLAARKGFLLPERVWDFAPREEWDPVWIGEVDPDSAAPRAEMSVGRAWAPYLLVAGILVLSRLPQLPFEAWLSGIEIEWTNIFGTEVSEGLQPFFLPGFMFLLAIVATYAIHRMSASQIAESWRVAGRQILGAGVALLFALPLVRVFINSGPEFNTSGLESMPLLLAQGAASVAGTAWPFFAPWIGARGAFGAGSNTVSNLMFSLFQFSTAEQIGIVPETVVATQAVGGAAGNMITVHNVVAASATVGLVGREGDLIRKTILPTIYYILMAGGLSLVAIYGFGANLSTLWLALLLAALVGLVLAMRRSPGKPNPELTVAADTGSEDDR
jgi:lactate permease